MTSEHTEPCSEVEWSRRTIINVLDVLTAPPSH